jgi:anaerobic magnesium-protoporphyrin IX monomethyl ester cyclase
MSDAVLVFPYFNDGRSPLFKFPPLGLGYIASALQQNGYSTKIVDCTFSTWDKAISDVRSAHPRVVGIYSMLSMVDPALKLAAELRNHCELLVAGGPMPSAYPKMFLGNFDLVIQGEGEGTMVDIMRKLVSGGALEEVQGIHIGSRALATTITARAADGGGPIFTGPRPLIQELDEIQFPARELYDNQAYQQYYRENYDYTITSMIASRGCPFCCDFCWRPDYGRFYRVRSPENIVDEMEEIVYRYGYERIWFADELFIASKKHVIQICEEIKRRKLDVLWECLARADIVDDAVAQAMRDAGCHKVIFGLEAGDDRTLKSMNKHLTVEQSSRAVCLMVKHGIKVGSFFILGYPGETNETMLKTIRLASRLPLDYFSMTVPYPLPGTGLYERVKDKMTAKEWEKPLHGYDHKLLFQHDFSIEKLKYGVWKAITQSAWRKRLGPLYPMLMPWELYTDHKFREMN